MALIVPLWRCLYAWPHTVPIFTVLPRSLLQPFALDNFTSCESHALVELTYNTSLMRNVATNLELAAASSRIATGAKEEKGACKTHWYLSLCSTELNPCDMDPTTGHLCTQRTLLPYTLVWLQATSICPADMIMYRWDGTAGPPLQ